MDNPAGKLYNWTIIAKKLEQFDIIIDQDLKTLLMAGDLEIIHEVLKDVYIEFNGLHKGELQKVQQKGVKDAK